MSRQRKAIFDHLDRDHNSLNSLYSYQNILMGEDQLLEKVAIREKTEPALLFSKKEILKLQVYLARRKILNLSKCAIFHMFGTTQILNVK